MAISVDVSVTSLIVGAIHLVKFIEHKKLQRRRRARSGRTVVRKGYQARVIAQLERAA